MFIALVNISFIICGFFIAFIGFRGYYLAQYNHEKNFLWSMSMFLVATNFIVYTIAPYLHIDGLNWLTHIIDNIIYIIQFAVVSMILLCNDLHECNICRIKKIRITMWIFLMVDVFIMIPMAFNYPETLHIDSTFQNLQILGIQWLDLGIEIVHTLIAAIIFYLLPMKDYKFLKIGFGIISVSEFLQIVNIELFNYAQPIIFAGEWITGSISIILMAFGIWKVVK